MGDARTGSAPTVLRLVLGIQLRGLRERAGLELEEAAAAIDVTHQTIRRMEKAEVGLKIPYVKELVARYGLSEEEREDFLALVREANKPGWWHRFRDVLPDWFSAYVSLEDAAELIRSYEPHYVPGLLQTEDYARAVLLVGSDGNRDELERRVAFRIKRQDLLTTDHAPTVWAVLDETVFRRSVGGPDVMRAQIDHLLEVAERPNVRLQIMPFAAGPHRGAFGPFHLFRCRLREQPDVIYTEGLTGAGYLDDRPDVAAYIEALDHMAVQAASFEQSRTILKDLREEL
ncbi:helix-turn-helix domain-containing protein [Streptomyces sp. NPDC057654]|uniref:helix-turn-helix domain-containing protein n=1 Tax=Streptomyces sp. NPDC057654 TaxID=3346196 RepID=UPI0036C2C3A7